MAAVMDVRQIMASSVRLLDPHDNLVRAARQMKKFDIGCVLVGSWGRVAGIVTDRDMVLRCLAIGYDPAEVTLAEVMTRDPTFCVAYDSVLQAARIMRDNQVRRLPVLESDRNLAGIVSLGDVCARCPPNLAAWLIEAVSRPRNHEMA
jgi:CBS domain-containing protein